MTAIANSFLRAKHWQIFLLVFLLPNALELVSMVHLPTRIWSWRDVGPWGFLFVGSMLFYILSGVFWFGAMGSFLNSIVKPELQMDARFFHLALVYPVIYMPIFFPLLLTKILLSTNFILPLHLGCMICLFYLLYFVSRCFGLVEKGKPVSFFDYAGPFFLLWFFPLGIWIIQPKVNQLYAERNIVASLAAPTAA
jgi:hypothetical protein